MIILFLFVQEKEGVKLFKKIEVSKKAVLYWPGEKMKGREWNIFSFTPLELVGSKPRE